MTFKLPDTKIRGYTAAQMREAYEHGLLVASALDGGGRKPMSNKTAVGLIDARWSELDLVRFVERHHGIGVKK